MSNIQKLWLSERVPALNGIYFSDDSVCLVDFNRLDRLGAFSVSSLKPRQGLPNLESTSVLPKHALSTSTACERLEAGEAQAEMVLLPYSMERLCVG